jgi:hypothetical protein
MTSLGEFLERFYGPHEFFRTVHARVRHSKTASPQSSSRGGRSSIGRPRRDAKPPIESTKELVFWAHLPDKVRIETTGEEEGLSKTTVEVVNGDSTWRRHVDGTVETGCGRSKRAREICSLPTEFQRHFDRGLLRQCFAALTLEVTGKCRVAGHECIGIRARQVPGAQLWPHWLSFDANEFEFAANVEHAVLLSIKAKEGQTTVEAHEVLEVTFGGKLDDSLFVYEPGMNEIVQEAAPVAEHVTLEAAAIRAPFVVLQPSYTPDPEQTHSEVMYHAARPTSKVESLTIFYRGGDSYDNLWIKQRCEPDERQQKELEWDELVVEGQRIEISDPNPEEGLRVLSCRRENTFVTIISDLPKDEMVKIALSLTPVRELDDKV